eukprot:350928-Chlamydomonas_euryale.AAC.2
MGNCTCNCRPACSDEEARPPARLRRNSAAAARACYERRGLPGARAAVSAAPSVLPRLMQELRPGSGLPSEGVTGAKTRRQRHAAAHPPPLPPPRRPMRISSRQVITSSFHRAPPLPTCAGFVCIPTTPSRHTPTDRQYPPHRPVIQTAAPARRAPGGRPSKAAASAPAVAGTAQTAAPAAYWAAASSRPRPGSLSLHPQRHCGGTGLTARCASSREVDHVAPTRRALLHGSARAAAASPSLSSAAPASAAVSAVVGGIHARRHAELTPTRGYAAGGAFGMGDEGTPMLAGDEPTPLELDASDDEVGEGMDVGDVREWWRECVEEKT